MESASLTCPAEQPNPMRRTGGAGVMGLGLRGSRAGIAWPELHGRGRGGGPGLGAHFDQRSFATMWAPLPSPRSPPSPTAAPALLCRSSAPDHPWAPASISCGESGARSPGPRPRPRPASGRSHRPPCRRGAPRPPRACQGTTSCRARPAAARTRRRRRQRLGAPASWRLFPQGTASATRGSRTYFRLRPSPDRTRASSSPPRAARSGRDSQEAADRRGSLRPRPSCPRVRTRPRRACGRCLTRDRGICLRRPPCTRSHAASRERPPLTHCRRRAPRSHREGAS
mmetsp:Transcript_41933/g.97040  ORF Transcript_41933/g.97040 Transcript_41933/m.97040 type:complete len:284 (-) Transcript_41933:856-1707(-)